MNKLPSVIVSGIPGSPSRYIEMHMTSMYYDSLISDLFLLFAMPSIERGGWRVMQSEALERGIWKRLDLKVITM